MEYIKIKINLEYKNKTIKEFLKINNVGRGKVEEIRVNKTSFINNIYQPLETILKENDILSFKIAEEIDYKCLNEKLDIVYEDDYLLIVNKPLNMLVHPDNKEKNGTLVNLVANYYKQNNINRKVRYLHRLDKETTGLVIFAKDFLTEAIMLKKLEENLITKQYIGIVEGKLTNKNGQIKASIATDRHINNKMCISKTGKKAITKYELIKEYENYSSVLFTLITGRTHQIRIHTSYINHPLLGDVLYGGNTKLINRVALHSFRLKFVHPILKTQLEIENKLPFDMQQLLK